jgi:hypothetical protein
VAQVRTLRVPDSLLRSSPLSQALALQEGYEKAANIDLSIGFFRCFGRES